MSRESDHSANGLEHDNTGGLMTGFLAEEEAFDRRALWRLGWWGAASVGAIIVALLANQFSSGLRREQVAASDLVRQSQQIQSIAKERQLETRRIASAIDTLNGDRDRLYSRVTVLEQGLESMTGAIARQTAAASARTAPAPSAAMVPPSEAQAAPPPAVSPVTTTVAAAAEKPRVEASAPPPAPATVTSVGQANSPPNSPANSQPNSPANSQASSAAPAPATPFVTAKSMLAPPDSSATKLIEPEKPAKPVSAAPKAETVASAAPAADAEPDESAAAPPKVAVQRTEFGVDVGGANSVGGLRALWRGLLKSRSNAALTSLRPIIVIKEGSTGLGMQLRLVAGPLTDAAAAAKICAGLIENERPCETTVFDGQRLAMKADEPAAAPAKPSTDKPNTAKPEATKLDAAKPDATQPVAAKPVAAKPVWHRRSSAKRSANDEVAKKPDPPSTFSSLFSRH